MDTNERTASDTDETVLVTGGCGYLGSQLVRDLGREETPVSTVRILDNLHRETHPSLLDLPTGVSYEFVEGDLLDPTAVEQALDGVDTVVHLAALVTTPFSHEHPRWTKHVNHWGTVRLLQDCQEADVDRFVLASSTSVLGPGGPHDEDDDPNPQSPYSRSKHGAEKAVRSTSEDLDATILRFGTIYGGHPPGIRFDAVPNRLVFEAATGQTVNLGAARDQTWPYVHVEDASSAVIPLLSATEFEKETLHVVAGNHELDTITAQIRSAVPDAEIRFGDDKATSVFSSEVAGERLRSTGWKPDWSIEKGIEDLVDRFGRFETGPSRGPLDREGNTTR